MLSAVLPRAFALVLQSPKQIVALLVALALQGLFPGMCIIGRGSRRAACSNGLGALVRHGDQRAHPLPRGAWVAYYFVYIMNKLFVGATYRVVGLPGVFRRSRRGRCRW